MLLHNKYGVRIKEEEGVDIENRLNEIVFSKVTSTAVEHIPIADFDYDDLPLAKKINNLLNNAYDLGYERGIHSAKEALTAAIGIET